MDKIQHIPTNRGRATTYKHMHAYCIAATEAQFLCETKIAVSEH